MLQVLLCAGMVVTLSMGIRHGFGLWLQPITQDIGLEPRVLLPGDCGAKHGLGHFGDFCWHLGRPLGRIQNFDSWSRALRLGFGRNGLGTHHLVVYFEHGPGHWCSAIGHNLCRGVWRAGPANPRSAAQLGHGPDGGGRLFRAVFYGAGRRGADCPAGLEQCLAGPGPGGLADRRIGLWPARAWALAKGKHWHRAPNRCARR